MQEIMLIIYNNLIMILDDPTILDDIKSIFKLIEVV